MYIFLPTFFVLLMSLVAGSPQRVSKRQCAATLTVATNDARRLQSHYYNTAVGQYNGGELWTDANTYETLCNLMLATESTEFSNILSSKTGSLGGNPNAGWNSYLAGSNDDSLWVVLMLYKMSDFLHANGQDFSNYMTNAGRIYDIIAHQWDSTCGGGVWWSTAHTYKNAITNQLFLLTSANGYLRTGNATYLQNAKNTWNWLSHSGMRNSQGLWNDGLDSSTCKNNGQTTWTYNQGVIASGLANLYVATGSTNTSLLDQAEITLDATISLLTVNGILKESCDDASAGGAVCNNDQVSFKGIWTKHLQYYLDSANIPSRTAKYQPFLSAQYSAIFHYGTSASQDIGSVWYAPDSGGSQWTPEASGSGLAGVVAAAKYGSC